MERDERFYSIEEQQSLISRLEDFAASDVEYYYGIFLNDTDELIGTINLFSILRNLCNPRLSVIFLIRRTMEMVMQQKR